MRELFVYYRVRAGREADALNAVNAFQSRLRQRFARLTTRLLRRSEAAGGTQTWMETYAMDAPDTGSAQEADGGISEQLRLEIETSALALEHCLEGARHVESFEPVPGDPGVG